jgi:hypothetical protein
MDPPIIFTRSAQIASPRPVPLCSRVIEVSTWLKASNRLP